MVVSDVGKGNFSLVLEICTQGDRHMQSQMSPGMDCTYSAEPKSCDNKIIILHVQLYGGHSTLKGHKLFENVTHPFRIS